MKLPYGWPLTLPVVRLLIFVMGFATTAPLLHSETTETVAGSEQKVIESQEIDFGDHSVILNRVEAPELKPTPTPEPKQAAPAQNASVEELGALEGAAKPEVFMFLSCTVFDHKVTEIHWQRADGQYVIWSSMDFNLMRGEMFVETEGVRYQLFLGVGNESRAEVEQRNAELDAALRRTIPDLGESTGTACYKVVSFPKSGVSAEVTQALDLLHRYYDTNHDRLVQQYAESEAARIAHEKWMQEHPPVPQDTTINYFPIKSVYGNAAVKGDAK
jgi:hypothetical protein